MIIVDVGCHPHGNEESVYKLCRHFRPSLLIGLDPYPFLREGDQWHRETSTLILRRRVAAWTRNQEIRYLADGITSGVEKYAIGGDNDQPVVTAVDLGSLLLSLPQPVVLKLDAEGSEYPILENLHLRGIDEHLDRAIVEWHPSETAHGFYMAPEDRPTLRCPVEDWEDW